MVFGEGRQRRSRRLYIVLWRRRCTAHVRIVGWLLIALLRLRLIPRRRCLILQRHRSYVERHAQNYWLLHALHVENELESKNSFCEKTTRLRPARNQDQSSDRSPGSWAATAECSSARRAKPEEIDFTACKKQMCIYLRAARRYRSMLEL